MKPFKNLALLVFLLLAFQASAQTDKATTKKIVEAKRYTFVATNAIPMNAMDINNILSSIPGNTGNNINLVGNNYDLKITPDSVIAFLPYYGRAFTAPISRDDSGIKFTSTKFDYTISKGKKRGWTAIINTNDSKENARMSLSVSENGYATLIVNTTNKQTITYNGYLSENKNND